MSSTALRTIFLFLSLVIYTSASPAKLNSNARQEVDTEIPIAFPISVLLEPTMEPTPMPEEPPMIAVDPPVADMMADTMEDGDMEPAVSGEPMMGFYYNIGGEATGMFEADPIDYVVGDTDTFEIPEAVITGDEENAEIYKSHRYGRLGSTWGYDIPVDYPGIYDCTLYYAEIYDQFFSEDPNRTFTVSIYGDGDNEEQTETFDVMVENGGQEMTAHKKTYTGLNVATTLHLRETPVIGEAMLSGISCELVMT